MDEYGKTGIKIEFKDIVAFLIIWEFFFADNTMLRIYPYIFWPAISVYSVLHMQRIKKCTAKHLGLLLIGLLYGFFSALFSSNANDGLMFVVEILLYITPALFLSLYYSKIKLLKIIYSLAFLHAILLYIQIFIPALFYSILQITGGSEMVSIAQQNASMGIYLGLTGQTSTISFFLVLGIAVSLFWYSQKRTPMRLLSIVFFILAVAFTNRRGNLICGLIIILMYFVLGKERVSKKFIIAFILIAVVLIIGVQNIPGISGIIEKFMVLQARGNLLSSRDQLWSDAIQLFLDNKVFGTGLGSYTYYVDATSAHNSYLQKLAELGIVGSVVYMFGYFKCYISTIVCTIRARRINNPFLNNETDIGLWLILVQTHIFIIALTEGIFETPAYYVIILIIQFIAIDNNDYLTKNARINFE